jgi:hypothetical protein
MTWTARPTIEPGEYPRGDEIEAILDEIEFGGNRLVGYGLRTSDTGNITTTETGVLRVDNVTLRAGVRYRVAVSTRPYSSVSTDTYKVRFRYTTDGTAATTSSTVLGTTYEMDQAHNCTHWATYQPAANETFSVLFTLHRAVGSGNVKGNADASCELTIEALGVGAADTGVDI